LTNFHIENVKLPPHIFKFLFFALIRQLSSWDVRNFRTLWRRIRTLIIMSKFWKWDANFTEVNFIDFLKMYFIFVFRYLLHFDTNYKPFKNLLPVKIGFLASINIL